MCRGAEKCFLAFAERLEDDGEPLVHQDYFKHTVAKAIIFRTAEKLFSTLSLEGYRANSVAYAVSWVAVHSEHRLDLNSIWNQQRISPNTAEALKNVCAAAYDHLTATGGNVGEWSKKAECWDAFREQKIRTPSGWQDEFAENPFLVTVTELDAIAEEWERVRLHFADDLTTLGELEVLTGKEWSARHRRDEACVHANRSWDELKGAGGRRYRNVRAFVELFSAAAKLRGHA